ncbi:MAG: gliding motility protein GldC [Niabella sp.]
MLKSTITIDVSMDENRVPDTISWNATESTIQNMQKAKAVILSLWDGADKAALRIDLWTKDMMMDEMADFFYQTLMTMADSFGRATKYTDQMDEMKAFAKDFYQKFRERQLGEYKGHEHKHGHDHDHHHEHGHKH